MNETFISVLGKIRETANLIVSEISSENNSVISDIAEYRKKYGVPEKMGKSFNSQVDAITSKVKNAGNDTSSWNAPSSQTARYKALSKAKASNWKEGFLLVEDGDLKYPFINVAGKAMLSGLYACKSRAASNGETRVVEIVDKVVAKLNLEDK